MRSHGPGEGFAGPTPRGRQGVVALSRPSSRRNAIRLRSWLTTSSCRRLRIAVASGSAAEGVGKLSRRRLLSSSLISLPSSRSRIQSRSLSRSRAPTSSVARDGAAPPDAERALPADDGITASARAARTNRLADHSQRSSRSRSAYGEMRLTRARCRRDRRRSAPFQTACRLPQGEAGERGASRAHRSERR